MGLKDRLPNLEIHATTISGTTIQAGIAEFGAGEIGADELATDSVVNVKISGLAVSKSKIANDALSGAQFEAVSIPAGKLAVNAVSGASISPEYAPVLDNTGTDGFSTQFGEFVTNSGSIATVTFGTAFAAAPIRFVTPTKDSTGWFRVDGTVTASGVIHSETASLSGAWIAIGSGRI